MNTLSLRYRLEELFFVLIILLSILDFFAILPGDLDYIKKIISIAIISYLLYRINISRIVFGAKNHRLLDIFIIVAFFMFFVKDFIAFAIVTRYEVVIFKFLISIIDLYSSYLEVFFFYLGGISLIIISLFITIKVPIKKPSFMAIIHEEGKIPKTTLKILERFFSAFFVLIIFFLFVFNLMVEWLAIAIDSPILIFGLLFYLFIIIRHYKSFSADNLIYKIGDFGEKSYKKFISLFHYKITVYLGIAGLLILHLLTETVVFILPYLIGIRGAFYHQSLELSTHLPFFYLFNQDLKALAGSGLLKIISLSWLYIFNIIAMILLFILPAFVLYKLYKKKGIDVHHIPLAIFFSSIAAFLLTPIFRMLPLQSEEIAGVDFQTFSILNNSFPLELSFFISLTAGILVLVLSYWGAIKKYVIAFGVLIVDIFFGVYIYYFFTNLFSFYIKTFIYLVTERSEYFIASFFLIFMTFTIIFYVFGYFVFLKETYQEYRNIR